MGRVFRELDRPTESALSSPRGRYSTRETPCCCAQHEGTQPEDVREELVVEELVANMERISCVVRSLLVLV